MYVVRQFCPTSPLLNGGIYPLFYRLTTPPPPFLKFQVCTPPTTTTNYLQHYAWNGKEKTRGKGVVVIICVKFGGGRNIFTAWNPYKKANRSSYNNIESFGNENDVSICIRKVFLYWKRLAFIVFIIVLLITYILCK